MWSVFRDKPLPGDLVIRRRRELGRSDDIYIVTAWPEPETAVAGPFPSYSSALEEARRLVKDRYSYVWYDYARTANPSVSTKSEAATTPN